MSHAQLPIQRFHRMVLWPCVAVYLLLASSALQAEPFADWHHLETERFEIFTDLPIAETQALGQMLTRFAALADHYVPTTESSTPLPLKLLVFSERRAFSQLMRPRHFAAFTQPGLKQTLLVVGPTGGDIEASVKHEYAHFRLRSSAAGFPAWFDEGLAVMLQYGKVDARPDGSIVGRIDRRALFNRYPNEAGGRETPSLRSILNTRRFERWDRDALTRFYGLSGQLVYYLLHEGTPGGAHEGAREGAPEDGEASIQPPWSSLPSAGRLARRLDRFKRGGARAGTRVELPAPAANPAKLGPADPFALLVLMSDAAADSNPAAGLARIESALRLKPAHSGAIARRVHLLMRLERVEEAERLIESQVRTHRDDPEFLVLTARLATRGCWPAIKATCRDRWQHAADQLRRALDADPDNLEAVYMLGMTELYRGRAGSAIPYLRAVHGYLAWIPRINFHLGEALRLVGDTRARIYLERARDWAETPIWREFAELSLSRL